MAKLIHLSDLHFGAHDPLIVTAVEKRLDDERPDLVVISGDFTQRARTDQFEEACAFLTRLQDKGHEVIAVPGNHDIPLYDVLRRFLSPLTRYKRFVDDALCPFLDMPDFTILGINTARSLTFKDGHISHEQIDYIRKSFSQTDPDKPRLLVMHHPLFAQKADGGGQMNPAMKDSDRALDLIEQLGVDLVMAGHNHKAMIDQVDDLVHGKGTTLIVQAGTATSTRTRDEQQSFNRIELFPAEIRVTIQRWDGEAFHSGDSESFHREGRSWRKESGERVEKAPETAAEVAAEVKDDKAAAAAAEEKASSPTS